ncbi:ribonuclease P protein component [Candidatus Kuenenbacteria bacterium CG11_big_fil_rev_8_21_14_0_20_37_9]|uniref:Ribonuclease P protein component n=1 Tax=Candidatus Kuenenbacteria bacterium CG08_land_8_20_14_0_20_37_23 TaxID=1974617 RepID=A0A2M6XTK3_9BACT|nr:MAG: ribonuclease P protein component [Candidatus Kuenenbacteria bacterium CG11_big_fil_rev_8_21_14_0_20_37_9]PIU10972.1 MAG: ribonuclease P protein component [Candidatus Kuenenbacteria bacterium CG08_land_8_20_14_0_20_37_23]
MLAKEYRLSKDVDFQKVYKKGIILFSLFFNVKYLENNLQNSRFGIVVSTKISKKAVIRNKNKRIIRNIIYENLTNISQCFDVIILAKPAITTVNKEKLNQSFIFMLKKANIYHKMQQ